MPTPFSVESKIVAPPVSGQPECPVPLAMAAAYDHRTFQHLEQSGSGSKTVDLGSLGPNGAKLLVIQIEPDASPAAQPILIAINSATPGIELAPGGFLVLASPKPTTAGALTLAITRTTSMKCNIWAFG